MPCRTTLCYAMLCMVVLRCGATSWGSTWQPADRVVVVVIQHESCTGQNSPVNIPPVVHKDLSTLQDALRWYKLAQKWYKLVPKSLETVDCHCTHLART